jgi:hypothetical protein
MRVIVRREGAPRRQAAAVRGTLRVAHTAFVSKTAAGALQWLEVRYRAHARVEGRMC